MTLTYRSLHASIIWGKNDVAQATKILEEVRRLMEASNSKVYYKTKRDYHGNFNQKINW